MGGRIATARSGVCRSAGRDVCRNGPQRASTAARSRSSASASRMRGSPTFSRMCPSPPGAEHLAVVERQSGACDEEVDERIVGQPQFPAVEPDEERRFGADRPDAGNVSPQEVVGEVDVRLDVPQHLPPPCVAFGRESRPGSDDREQGRLVELTRFEPAEKAAAQRLVGDDRVGTDHAGDVEGLGQGRRR